MRRKTEIATAVGLWLACFLLSQLAFAKTNSGHREFPEETYYKGFRITGLVFKSVNAVEILAESPSATLRSREIAKLAVRLTFAQTEEECLKMFPDELDAPARVTFKDIVVLIMEGGTMSPSIKLKHCVQHTSIEAGRLTDENLMSSAEVHPASAEKWESVNIEVTKNSASTFMIDGLNVSATFTQMLEPGSPVCGAQLPLSFETDASLYLEIIDSTTLGLNVMYPKIKAMDVHANTISPFQLKLECSDEPMEIDETKLKEFMEQLLRNLPRRIPPPALDKI